MKPVGDTSALLTQPPVDTIQPTVDHDPFLYREDLKNRGIKWSMKTIRDKMRRGEFPMCVKIGNRNAWRKSAIDEWCRSRPPGFISPALSALRRKLGLKGNYTRWNYPQVRDATGLHWITKPE